MTPQKETSKLAKTASAISLLAGIWLFVSPWAYVSPWVRSAYMAPNVWNNWIVGALIFIFAASRFGEPTHSWSSWINVLLGAWTFASPWIYGYTTSREWLINSVCVGVVVFVAAMLSASAHPHIHGPMPSGTRS